MKRKIFSIFLAGILSCTMLFSACAADAPSAIGGGDSTVSPLYIKIVATGAGLSLENSWGMMLCEGYTQVVGDYDAVTTLELQWYVNGDWETIKTWTSAPNDYEASVSEYWYVESGYAYRSYVTHQSYSGSTLIETVYTESDIVYY